MLGRDKSKDKTVARAEAPAPEPANEDTTARVRDTDSKTNAPLKAGEVVTVGNVYRDRDTGLEVIPYFLDFGTNVVQFSNVGRGNEERLRQDEFLRRFEDTGGAISPALGEKA